MNYTQKLKALLRSTDPKNKEAVERLQAELLAMKSASGVAHNNTTLSNISIQYKNDDYIGLDLMPLVPVNHKSDDFIVYSKRDRLAGPDDSMSKRSRANEINESRSLSTYSCKDYALMNYVDNETLRDEDAPLDEEADLIDAVNDVLALKREQRIAAIMTTGANFGGNTAALSGTDQWDNAANTNIIQTLQNGIAALYNGNGASDIVGYTSLDVYNVMSRSTTLRGLFNYVEDGLATPDRIARYLGLSKLLVGAARQDTANEGQAAAYSRIWGKTFGVVRVARKPVSPHRELRLHVPPQGRPRHRYLVRQGGRQVRRLVRPRRLQRGLQGRRSRHRLPLHVRHLLKGPPIMASTKDTKLGAEPGADGKVNEQKPGDTVMPDIPPNTNLDKSELASGKSKSTGESIAFKVWPHGAVHRDGKVYQPGSKLLLSEEDAAALGDSVTREDS